MRQEMTTDVLSLARQVSRRFQDAKGSCDGDATAEKSHAKTQCEKPAIHGVSIHDLRQAAEHDWEWLQNDPKALEAFANCIATTRSIRAGIVPAEYTATTTCKQCGPVPIFGGCPPQVLGCPWCFVGGYRHE